MAYRSLALFSNARRVTRNQYYPASAKGLKAKVFGLNEAKFFNENVEAKRQDLPKDYLSHIKMAYLEEGPIPSHRAYGWASASSKDSRPLFLVAVSDRGSSHDRQRPDTQCGEVVPSSESTSF